MKLAEQLHKWYLESLKKITPKDYNQRAAIPFKKLSENQKKIDEYIANKILKKYIKRGDKDA